MGLSVIIRKYFFNNECNFKPKKMIFMLVSILVPWQTVGFEIKGMAVYLSLFFCFLDVSFWIGLVNYKFLKCKFYKIIIFTIIIAFIVLRSKSIIFTFFKLSLAIFFIFYLSQGFKHFSAKYLQYSVVCSCYIAVFQFVEANLIGTSYLSMKNYIFKVTQEFIIGIGANLGGSYDVNGIIPGFTRVSGSALEPGHFNLMLFSLIPFLKPSLFSIVLILCGFIASASKITILYLVLFPFLFLATEKYRIPFWLIFISIIIGYFFIGSYFVSLYQNKDEIFSSSSSLYSRLEPVFVFQDLPMINKIIGTGYRKACDFLPASSFIYGGKYQSPYVYLSPTVKVCIAGVSSSIGSFIIENGILGALLITSGLQFISKKRKRQSNYKLNSKIKIYSSSFCLSLFFISNQAVHYLTTYPCLCCLIAYIVVYSDLKKINDNNMNRTLHVTSISG